MRLSLITLLSKCLWNQRKKIQDSSFKTITKASTALQRVSAQLLKIPPRSPDLIIQSVENMFKSVSDDLHDSAIEEQLERESFAQFKKRVKNTIGFHAVAKINN